MKKYDSKALVEAGLITALILVLSIFNNYVPVFSMLGNFLIPIPFTILYLRQGKFSSLVSLVASGLLMSMFYNPIGGLLSSAIFGFTGITLGYCIKKNKNIFVSIGSLAIVSTIGTLIRFGIYVVLINKQSIATFIKELVNVIHTSINASINIYTNMGVDPKALEPIKEYIKLLTPELFLSILPAFIILSAIVSGYLNYVVTCGIIRKLGYNIKEVTPFRNIYVNSKVASILGIILLVGVILDRYNIVYAKYILNSSAIIMKFVLSIDGLALVMYYIINRFHMSKPFIIFITIFLMFSQLSVFLFYLGLIDVIFDFRKLDPNRNYNVQQ